MQLHPMPMPILIQTTQGRVTGLWGTAYIRGTDGKMHLLKLGDMVHKGDEILTTQNGIVQLTPEDSPTTQALLARLAQEQPDIDRVYHLAIEGTPVVIQQ